MISIITPCLNRVGFVSEAIESVLHQNYSNFEHIIVDGGSTDGTLDILQSYPHLKVISEPDQGLYDAINKGLRHSEGEIIGFLNTDDLYEIRIFETVLRGFQENPKAAAVVGGVTIFDVDEQSSQIHFISYSPVGQHEIWGRITQGAPIFNAWFFRRSVFNVIGTFNIKYRYVADRDFLIRFARNDFPHQPIDQVVYHYRQHADSLTFKHNNTAEAEFIFELRSMIEDYLETCDNPIWFKKIIQSWHSQVASDQVLFALSRLKFVKALSYSLRGWRYNPNWPLEFFPRLTTSSIRNIKRIFQGDHA